REFREQTIRTEGAGAIILNTADSEDCRILLEAASWVGRSERDFYVSDLECQQVYLLHHHDKIVISVHESELRAHLIGSLVEQKHLFLDFTRYVCPDDEQSFSEEKGEEKGTGENGIKLSRRLLCRMALRCPGKGKDLLP